MAKLVCWVTLRSLQIPILYISNLFGFVNNCKYFIATLEVDQLYNRDTSLSDKALLLLIMSCIVYYSTSFWSGKFNVPYAGMFIHLLLL